MGAACRLCTARLPPAAAQCTGRCLVPRAAGLCGGLMGHGFAAPHGASLARHPSGGGWCPAGCRRPLRGVAVVDRSGVPPAGRPEPLRPAAGSCLRCPQQQSTPGPPRWPTVRQPPGTGRGFAAPPATPGHRPRAVSYGQPTAEPSATLPGLTPTQCTTAANYEAHSGRQHPDHPQQGRPAGRPPNGGVNTPVRSLPDTPLAWPRPECSPPTVMPAAPTSRKRRTAHRAPSGHRLR